LGRGLATRLNDSFRLLTGGRRTALPRQSSRDVHSYGLLAEAERIVSARLGFLGGFP